MNEDDFRRLLDESAAETQRRFDETAERLTAEMRTYVDTSAAETQRRIDASAAEAQRHFNETAERLAGEMRTFVDTRFVEVKQDLRTYFDVVVEGMDHKIGLIAESVLMVNEKLDRESAARQQGFADTQAMIKFSHAELDRRIHAVEERSRTLEESVHKLQARMDRLEAMTATQ